MTNTSRTTPSRTLPAWMGALIVTAAVLVALVALWQPSYSATSHAWTAHGPMGAAVVSPMGAAIQLGALECGADSALWCTWNG